MMKIQSTLCVLAIAFLFIAVGAAEAGKAVDAPERAVVGQTRDLQLVPDLDRAVLVGATWIWGDTIHIQDAFFLKPHFAAVNLRAGDAIVVRSASGKIVETITSRGPKDMGSFWGLSARGEDLHLEFQFTHDYAVAPFRVDKVMVGDADPFGQGGNTKSICGAQDFEDVICYDGDAEKWQTILASVGIMTVGSNPSTGLWCSGVNVSPHNYMLSAQHCILSQGVCNSTEFVFKYHNVNCGSGPTTTNWVSYRCDDIMVTSPWSVCEVTPSTLDLVLASVIGDPASTFGYVDVDPDPVVDGEAIYIVQHPLGRPQEIAHGSGSDVDADAPMLRYYNTLDSDAGSSGGPIFRETDHKLVGVHHCSGCEVPGVGNRGIMSSEIYPLIEDYVCSDTIDVRFAATEGLAEVTGDGDAVVEHGETWQFDPLVRNVACTADAFGVIADIELNPDSTGPVNITNGAASFGDVLAGETVTSQLPVIFEVGETAECGADIVFDMLDLDATNGGPFPDAPEFLSVTIGELIWSSLLLEDFASGIPGNWTVVHNGTATGDAATWTTENPGGVNLPLTEPFAIVDSDHAGSGATHDEELITRQVDCSTYDKVELRFNHEYRWWSGGGNEQADVDVRSAATGGAWVNVANYSGQDASGNEEIDISDLAAGQPDVEIRFHYHDAWYDYWWAVDDVQIYGGQYDCGAETGLIFADGFESGDLSNWS